MNRREFLRACGTGAAATACASGLSAQSASDARPLVLPADRRHGQRRPAVPPQQRRLRRQAAAGNARLGLRVPRLRRRRLAGHPARQRHGLARPQAAAHRRCALYRNNRNGTFTDVTRSAGLDVEMYGMGVAVGDFNNDGFPDVLITCVGQNRLFRNTGKGTFVDVTRASGLGGRTGFSTSALWFDFDRDGLLDLFVCNYVKWTAGARCVLQPRRQAEVVLHAGGLSRRHVLAVPQSRQRHVRGRDGDERHLRHAARSRSAWRCSTTTRTAGRTSSSPTTRSRTSCIATCGTARSGTSRSRPGWRSARTARRAPAWASTPADFDNSGAAGLVVTNFDNEMIGLYRPSGRGLYEDVALKAGVGAPSRSTLGFGCVFADVDLDGRLDLVVANGHIDETVRNIRGNVGYAQPPHLFLNQGNGTFRDAAADAGPEFAQPRVGRGLACGDFDRDGDVDLLMTTNNGPARSVPQRPARRQSQPPVSPDRHTVESRRHRRDRPHLSRRHLAIAPREERIELPVAVGAAGDVRRRQARPRRRASSSPGRTDGPRSSRTSRPAGRTTASRARGSPRLLHDSHRVVAEAHRGDARAARLMTRLQRAAFAASACVLGTMVAGTVGAAAYLFGVKHYHYTAVRPIFHVGFIRSYLFDWKFRRLVALMDQEDAQYDDVFASIWDTSEGTLLSKKMFHPVEMYGLQKYMYNPGLVRLSFRLDVDGFGRSFSLVDSPGLRQAVEAIGATDVHRASYDRFGFRNVDSVLTERCAVRVVFLGDSFTDGVSIDDRETAVNRYGHVARERGRVDACPVNTGVDGYGTLEESFVLEHYFEALGRPAVAIVMHFPNDVDVDPDKVIDGAMADPSRAWAANLEYLRRIAEFGRRRGVAIVVAAIPVARQAANPSTRSNYQDVVRRFCEREGVRFVDLLDSLSAHDVREIYLEGDPHWTAKGHEVVAEMLYEQTRDLLAASISASQPRPDRRTP